MYLGVFLVLPSLRSPQHWSRLSDPLSPEAGCAGGSKDPADENVFIETQGEFSYACFIFQALIISLKAKYEPEIKILEN